MVELNGKQKLLRNGQSLTPQVKLKQANTKFALFEVNGKVVEMTLNRHTQVIQQSAQPKASSTNLNNTTGSVQILKNLNDMYRVPGFINGRQVGLLVDTGATLVAMDQGTADKLGIQYRTQGKKSLSRTAAGVVSTWHVTLASVKVGTIELKNVRGSVIKGEGPPFVLLGQSFLNQLNVQSDGRLMTLTKKF